MLGPENFWFQYADIHLTLANIQSSDYQVFEARNAKKNQANTLAQFEAFLMRQIKIWIMEKD